MVQNRYGAQLFSLFILLFSYSLSADLFGQDRSALRVVVISNDDGTPVIGATVMLFEDETDTAEMIHAGASNRDGFHEFDRVQPGSYLLEVRFVGHETVREMVDISEGDRQIKRVYLDYLPAEFDEVIVEERRGISTGEVGLRRISSTDIDRIPTPGAGGDLSSYIQTLPGVVSGGDRGGELFIRGGTPSQNLILVDNLQIIKPFHISNLYSAFPTDLIQNVDMYAGGFGAEYLGATSAVLDLSLRPGSMRNSRGSASVSPHLVAMQYEGPFRRDNQSIIMSGRFSTIEQTSQRITGEEVPINFYDFTARYTLLGDDLTCSFTGIRTYDRGEINPLRNIDLTWSNTVAGGRCFGFDERFNYPLDVTIGYMTYKNTQQSRDVTEMSSSIRDIFFRVDHKEELLSQPFDYGFGVKFRSFDTELAERFADFRSISADRAIVHGYVSLEFSPLPGVRIQPSLGSQMTLETVPTFEPRVRAAYGWGSRNSKELSFAVGIYNQVMEGITDERDAGTVFTVWRPNEMNEPLQQALHTILGYQHEIGPFRLNLEGYTKTHSNIPVSKWTPLARVEIETALADGFTYGFDTRLQFNRRSFYGFIGYGFAVVDYEAVSGDLGAWVESPVFSYRPAHDQRHKLNTVLSYNFAGFRLNTAWEFGTGMPYTSVYGFDLSLRIPDQNPMTHPGLARTLFSEPYDRRLPTYHRLDVSLEHSFNLFPGVRLDVEVGAINMYDRENIFYYDLNILERVDQTPLMPYISVQTKIN